jgi:hypothetical protein
LNILGAVENWDSLGSLVFLRVFEVFRMFHIVEKNNGILGFFFGIL